MEAAQTHLLENVDLSAQFVGLEIAVPSPEGGTAVLGGGILEELSVQRGGCSVLVVDHTITPVLRPWGGTLRNAPVGADSIIREIGVNVKSRDIFLRLGSNFFDVLKKSLQYHERFAGKNPL
jgi:hypothetical protein